MSIFEYNGSAIIAMAGEATRSLELRLQLLWLIDVHGGFAVITGVVFVLPQARSAWRSGLTCGSACSFRR